MFGISMPVVPNHVPWAGGGSLWIGVAIALVVVGAYTIYVWAANRRFRRERAAPAEPAAAAVPAREHEMAAKAA